MVHQSRNFFVDGVPGFYPHGGAGAKRDHAKALSRKEFNSPVRRASFASWRLCVIDWSKNQSKKTISEEKGRDTAFYACRRGILPRFECRFARETSEM